MNLLNGPAVVAEEWFVFIPDIVSIVKRK